MNVLALAILFFIPALCTKMRKNLKLLGDIIGVPPGPKLDEIQDAICNNDNNTLAEDLWFFNNDVDLKSFVLKKLHAKRCNDYIITGCFYKIPEEKKRFKIGLSLITGIPPGSKLDEIMTKFTENGYNAVEDLWYVEKEELQSFGLKKLHILRWRIYFTQERIYLIMHRWQYELTHGIFTDYPEELSMRLEEAVENFTGPIIYKITNAAYRINPAARTETHLRFGKTRKIRRVQVRVVNRISLENALIRIIDLRPGPILDKIVNAFYQNGYKDMSDLWFVEIEQLKSLGFRESHLKRWIHYFKNSRIYLVQNFWQVEMDDVRWFYTEEVSRHLEEALESGTYPIAYTDTNGTIFEIDPVARTQKNVQTGKTHNIRRIENSMHWNNDIQFFFANTEDQ